VYSGLLSRALVTTAGMGIQGLSRFVYTILIGRVLGPETLSDISSVLSLAVYFALLWPTGTSIAASRYLPIDGVGQAHLGELKRHLIVSASILGALAVPVAWVITGEPVTALLAALLVISYSAYVFVRGAMLGHDRYLRASILDTVSSGVTIGCLVLVLLGRLDWLVLLPLSLGYVVFAVLGWPRGPFTRLAVAERRAVTNFVRDTSIAALATGGLLPATMLFVQLFDTKEASGLFAAGLSLATPASLLSQSLNQVLIPYFARVAPTGVRELAKSHLRIVLASVVAFASIFGTLILAAPVILELLYGSRYLGGVTPMRTLLIVVMLVSCTSAPSALLVVIGRQRLYARIWLIAFVTGTATMVLLSPLMGMAGALIGLALGSGGGAIVIIGTALLIMRPTAQRSEITDENTAR
jgi:O-antigen/teichoic acid export membrane protein